MQVLFLKAKIRIFTPGEKWVHVFSRRSKDSDLRPWGNKWGAGAKPLQKTPRPTVGGAKVVAKPHNFQERTNLLFSLSHFIRLLPNVVNFNTKFGIQPYFQTGRIFIKSRSLQKMFTLDVKKRSAI